jgi:hypothetical protein
MATCAAIVEAVLPQESAEDSRNLLPLLLGESLDAPLRDFTLHQTISNALAIRRGPWKLLDHQGSGGNNYENERLQRYANPDSAPDAPAQLYNLEDDPGETRNLYFDEAEVAAELRAALERSKADGRSDFVD